MRMPRIIIKPPTVVFFVLLLLADGASRLFIPFCAALFHEAGHLIAMFALGYSVDKIEITVFGADIRLPCGSTRGIRDIAVYAAGGTANLLSAAVTVFFSQNEAARMFGACSVVLAALNFLPIKNLDGGCIVRTAAEMLFPNAYLKVTETVFAATLLGLWLVSVWLLIAFDGNISLLLFCCYLFATVYLK